MKNSRVSGLHLRDARSDELDRVALVIKEAYQQYQPAIPSESWQAYVEDMTDVRSRVEVAELIVAEMDRGLVGAVTLFKDTSSVRQMGWPEGWAAIRLLAVHPAYRGRRIGRTLMEECIRRCRKRGMVAIGLHTTEFMEVARGMYERMGFIRAPEFDHHPSPETVVMAYRLDL